MKNRKFNDIAQLVQQYAQRGEKNGLACSLLHPVNVEPDDDEIGKCSEFSRSSCFWLIDISLINGLNMSSTDMYNFVKVTLRFD